ncbi:MAG: MFS transporter [Candidatus Hodarchaeota archaeon]
MDSDFVEEDQPTNGGFRQILQRKDFMKLWVGQSVSNIGSSISNIALLFFAFDIGQTASAMAGLAIVQVLPLIIFSGMIGVYVDRWDRKRIMIAADVIRAATMFVMPFVVFFPSFLPPLYWLYLVAFIYSTVNAFFFPARSAAIPSLVEKDELVTANSLSQMTFQLISLIVTPVGGVIVAIVRPDYFPAFLIDSISFILSAIAIISISASLAPPKIVARDESFIREIIEGGRMIRESGLVTSIIMFFTILMFGGGMVNALIIPFMEGEIFLNEIQLSLIFSASAVTGIAGAAWLGRKARIGKPLYMIAASMTLAGGVILSISLITTFPEAILLFSMIGLVNVTLGVPANALLQEIIDGEKLGRVYSFESILTNTSQVLGMALSGVWADTAGSSRPPLFTGGLFILLVGILGAAFIRRNRLHDDIDQIREELSEKQTIDLAASKDQSSEEIVEIADASDDNLFMQE